MDTIVEPRKYWGNINQLKYRIGLTKVKGKWTQDGLTYTFTPRKGGTMTWHASFKTVLFDGDWFWHDLAVIQTILEARFDV